MQRNEKLVNLLKELTAEFLNRENNKTSLITVTSATVSPDLKRATVFITVLPETKENEALLFVRRKLGKLHAYISQKIPGRNIPFLQIGIDSGEKNRQKIDELLKV